jgi:molybdate transport system regulatory protein
LATLEGEIWLTDSTANRLALDQIGLLQAIHDTGSISAAAKSIGISYKTAWERLERLNNLSASPLVLRSSGGSKGGGTRLTEYGLQIIKGFTELQQQHQQFIQNLNKHLASMYDISGFVKHSALQVSARNQFLGTIHSLQTGAVNTEVIVDIADSLTLVAVVTERSREELALVAGVPVLAMIKASSVTLALGAEFKVSARNRFAGSIARIERGAVNTDVSIDLGNSKTLSAIITNHSAETLALETAMPVCAFFKASSVILLRN